MHIFHIKFFILDCVQVQWMINTSIPSQCRCFFYARYSRKEELQKFRSVFITLEDEKLLHKNNATAFCSSTVNSSKSFGYFMRCLSLLSICKKLQKSSRRAAAASNLINFARISELSDLHIQHQLQSIAIKSCKNFRKLFIIFIP